MAFEGLRQNISELDKNVNAYFEHSIEYAKLKSFKISMVLVTYLAKVLMVGSIAVLALIFLSLAASFALGYAMDNTVYGFATIGILYLLFAIIGYLFRDRLNKPLLQLFSKYFFEEP
ncbi:hypothetical protein [uncultured Eudoraea sp.]|uniref:hypothetical protein n=1 Tax=uncultured Eudoraea sp. TaxID=1035614 RepID=UPI00261968D9|nr:hypothetical protein [uncultured Eudoraea sp.]